MQQSWGISSTSIATADGGTGLQVGGIPGTSVSGAYHHLIYPNYDYGSPWTPSGNPDYSSLTGTKYYYRNFWSVSENGEANGIFNITGTNVTETNLTNGNFILEISLDGTTWYDCKEHYSIGALPDNDGPRINWVAQNLDTNSHLEFTLGTWALTSDTGKVAVLNSGGYGIFFRIGMPTDSTVKINKIEITNW